jgi:hypothetical protein
MAIKELVDREPLDHGNGVNSAPKIDQAPIDNFRLLPIPMVQRAIAIPDIHFQVERECGVD